MVEPMRVLFLDDYAYLLDNLKRHCDLDVVQYGQSAKGTVIYPEATEDLQAEITRLTAEDPPFDLIVIGNNLGTGLGRAKAIPDDLKGRTIVIWNANSDQRERPKYERMGITHFGVRDDSLTPKFLTILGVTK